MQTLTLSMYVKTNGHLRFSKFLPDLSDAIVCEQGGITLSIFVDPASYSESQFPAEDISRTIGIFVHKIAIKAELGVSDDLRQLIEKRAPIEDPDIEQKAREEYEDVGRRLYVLISAKLNRMFEYVLTTKGQYELDALQDQRENPGQFFLKNQAGVSFPGSSLYLFNSDRVVTIRVPNLAEESFISPQDWPSIRAFVVGQNSSPVVGRLTANYRRLALSGYRRTALIEAVSALEVRLNEFARACDGRLLTEELTDRLGHNSVKKLIAKVGLRGSFGVALPLLLSEQQMPSSILVSCAEAIEYRGNLVHNGTPNVNEEKLSVWLDSIESCCINLQAMIKPESASLMDEDEKET